MKVLLLDSRPEAYYTAPLSNDRFPGHNLEIQATWPVVPVSRWSEFVALLEQEPGGPGAVIIHTSDASAAFPSSSSAFSEVAKTLSRHRNLKPVLFFSGGSLIEPQLFEQAMQGYSGTARACSLTEVKRLIHEFAETGDFSVFEVFPQEVALQALSTLWPLGLFWETTGSKAKAVEAWRAVDRARVSEFEDQLYLYASELLAQDKEANTVMTAALDGHESKYRVFRQWMSKLGAGDAAKIVAGINQLLYCTTLSDWNRQLEVLRDEWLELSANDLSQQATNAQLTV